MSNENAAVAAELKPQETEVKAEATDNADVQAQPAEQPEETTEKRRTGAEKRITRLIRERAELKAKAEYLERALNERTPKAEGQPDEKANVRELVEKELAERERQSQLKSVEAKRDRIFSEASKDGDFDSDDFLESTVITPVMAEAILDSDLAPKIVKYFYANPEEAERIADLSAARQAAEIGKLELKLNAPTVVKKSGAPAPIKPVSGGSTKQQGYREDMSDAEYAEWRKSAKK